ncbi:albusnodin family lasso peptide [Actinacidiphila epipremni]|jgi:hypothetical protein|uniref:Albusnodin family lasso peptide n=1 Tax=Actinacidiphila epipremni TaxID=2053013 RepID=A0ABX0ZN87_9ACTN|nr:albusnodin family lasso peptide [Actinacidiphila epipremni]NJP44721.1 albusnodin family lasso peptide [Actinacidiphila epipremni]
MEQRPGPVPGGTDDEDPLVSPRVIVLGDAATLTKGGQGSSTEDKRYQYG